MAHSISIYGNTIDMSDERAQYCIQMGAFQRKAVELANKAEEFYRINCCNIMDVVNNFTNVLGQIWREAAKFTLGELIKKDIFDYDENKIVDAAYNNGASIAWITELSGKVSYINQTQAKALGEGIDNAVYTYNADGALESVLGSILFLSSLNDIGEASRQLSELYLSSETVYNMRKAIMYDVMEGGNFFIREIMKNCGINYDFVSKEDYEKSNSYCNNLYSGTIPNEKQLEIWISAIKLNPLNDRLYGYALGKWGHEDESLKQLIDFVNIDISQPAQDVVFNILINEDLSRDGCVSALKEKLEYYFNLPNFSKELMADRLVNYLPTKYTSKKFILAESITLRKEYNHTFEIFSVPAERYPSIVKWMDKVSKKERHFGLWVLGWIFIFPLPLTLILLKKKEMNVYLRYGIIGVAWIVYLVWMLSGMLNQAS